MVDNEHITDFKHKLHTMDVVLQTQSIMTDKMEVGEESDLVNEKVRFVTGDCQVVPLNVIDLYHVIEVNGNLSGTPTDV